MFMLDRRGIERAADGLGVRGGGKRPAARTVFEKVRSKGMLRLFSGLRCRVTVRNSLACDSP